VAKHWQFNLMTAFILRNVLIIALLTGFFALLLYYYGLKNTPCIRSHINGARLPFGPLLS